jgi:hypothetical protein
VQRLEPLAMPKAWDLNGQYQRVNGRSNGHQNMAISSNAFIYKSPQKHLEALM